MDPARLRDILAVLREAGIRAAKVPLADARKIGAECVPFLLEVEFERSGPSGGTEPVLRDSRTGAPVDLSEGAPETARDLDAEIAAKNFTRPEST